MSKESDAKKTIVEFTRKLYDMGYMPGIDSNISMRVTEDTVLVTCAGVCKGMITQDDLVLMSVDGEKLSGEKDPTSEAPMHLAAMKYRSEINVAIHSHSPNVCAFAMARKRIDTRSAPFAWEHLDEVGYVPYSAPGFPKFHEDAAAVIKGGYKAIVLENHGSLVLGEDMMDAYVKVDLLEAYAGMLMKATQLGGAYVMTDKELSEIFFG